MSNGFILACGTLILINYVFSFLWKIYVFTSYESIWCRFRHIFHIFYIRIKLQNKQKVNTIFQTDENMRRKGRSRKLRPLNICSKSSHTYCQFEEGFAGGASGKEPTCQCKRHKGCGFSLPWVGKIPWRMTWQPTQVFFPGESPAQESLVGYSPWGHKELDMAEQLNTHRRRVTPDSEHAASLFWVVSIGGG